MTPDCRREESMIHTRMRFPCVLFFTATLVVLSLSTFSAGGSTRRSPLAGSWYPEDASALKKMVRTYLNNANPPRLSGHVIGLICPHAGYRYSGQAAAYGFKLLEGKLYDRVLLIGPSHHERFHGLGISAYDAYETPLGPVPVDKGAIDQLARCPLFRPQPAAEAPEHSLEMQLPFLQLTLKRFAIVPIIVGQLDDHDCAQAAEQLRSLITDRTLILISSDFTHYGRRFGYLPFTDAIKQRLTNLDGGAVETILAKNVERFNNYIQKTGSTICGSRPIALLLRLLPETAAGTLLTYYTSGDLNGDYSSTVSYAAIAFCEASPK